MKYEHDKSITAARKANKAKSGKNKSKKSVMNRTTRKKQSSYTSQTNKLPVVLPDEPLPVNPREIPIVLTEPEMREEDQVDDMPTLPKLPLQTDTSSHHHNYLKRCHRRI